jgi:hypothetical protein
MKNELLRRDEAGNLIPTRPMLQKEFVTLYNSTRKQFLSLIELSDEPIGEPCGRYYSIRQGALIIKCIGEPNIKKGSPTKE